MTTTAPEQRQSSEAAPDRRQTSETATTSEPRHSSNFLSDGWRRALAVSAGERSAGAVLSAGARKIISVVAAVLVVGLVAGATFLALKWPFSQGRITQSLQEDFPASVSFQKFHSTFFPHPGCVGEGVAFRRLGSPPNTPPIVTIQRLAIKAHYMDLILRPGYLSHIEMKGFRVYVPSPGTPRAASNWHSTKSTTRVDEIIGDGASIEIARSDNHPPLRFDIPMLRLGKVSQSSPLSYKVTLHNPLPPGEISSEGRFGPWNLNDPGQTPVQGQYSFQNADLGVFDGIAGTLSSADKFQGVLARIESQGRIDIPNFMVTRSKHAVHLAAQYHAFVDGTNGNVQLERVTADFLKTQVLANGEIASQREQHGKTASIQLTVHDGRIQDVLRLFVREPRPPLNGVTSFNAHVVVPPEKQPFVQKVRLTGDFGIEGGKFEKKSTQKDMDALSDKSRGAKPNEQAEDEDPERVISNLAGHVELRDGITTFTNTSFTVPGALARMQGTYNLQTEAVNLRGTLKTEAELSKMNSGIKSMLLKPFDIFFKKKHAGAVVPVHLVGTYKHPNAGLDIPPKGSTAKPPRADSK